MVYSEPKISVVLPVYNCEKYIAEAIQSILSQTFTDFELLIIDDGSIDNTLSIVRQFQDPRIIIHSRTHLGLVDQLNFGLEAARSDIIARMDADDISLPDRFRLQYEFLSNNKEVGVLGTAYVVIDEDGISDHNWHFPVSNEDIKNSFPVAVAVSHGTVMYRKEIIKKCGGYQNVAFPVEDLDLWLRLYNVTLFANLDEILLKRRIITTSVTQSKADEVQNTLLRIALEFIESRMTNSLSVDVKLHLQIQSARIEYYYGSILKARKYLLNLLVHQPYNLQVWRYFLPSLIPEKVFWILRNKGVFTFITKYFRGKNHKSKYSL